MTDNYTKCQWDFEYIKCLKKCSHFLECLHFSYEMDKIIERSNEYKRLVGNCELFD